MACCALLLFAGSPLPAATAEPEPTPLPSSVIDQAVLLSALTFPSPGEFFAALAKAGRPNLSAAGRVPIPMSISARPRIALVVGLLLADGYLAVENQSSQDMKNIGRDLVEMARKLNSGDNVIARGRSITDFAENNDWNSLREELEATRNEIRISLTSQKDPGLSLLVSLGAWMRSIQAGSLVVASQYAPQPASLFLQSELVEAMGKRAAILPPRFLETPWVQFILKETSGVGQLMIPPADSPNTLPESNISQIKTLTSSIVNQLLETPPGEFPKTGEASAPDAQHLKVDGDQPSPTPSEAIPTNPRDASPNKESPDA